MTSAFLLFIRLFKILAHNNKVFVLLIKVFARQIEVFVHLLGKGRGQGQVALVALRRAQNLLSALFFLIAFSFAAAFAKEKAGIDRFAEQTRLASPRQEQSCRRRRLRERFFEKSTFLVLFTDEKYQKSSKDFPSLENLPASSRFTLCKQSSPSGANIASEPSGNSLTSATGSKR